MQICVQPEQSKCINKPGYKVNENQDLSETRQSINLASKRVPTSSFNGSIPDHCPAHDDGDVVHLPHESDCTLFYKCVEGDKIIQQCPPGLHFNPDLQVCDLPEHAKCTSKPGYEANENQDLSETRQSINLASKRVPTSSFNGSIPDHCPAHDDGDVVHLPHESDCTLFYKCVEGDKIIQQCPPGLHFNAVLQVCDLPEHAKCTSKPGYEANENQDLSETRQSINLASKRVQTSSFNGSIPDHCPAHDDGDVVHLPHESDCTLFYKCVEGDKIIQQCPPGLHFNPDLQVCDLPEHAKCTSKPGYEANENQDLSETRQSINLASKRVPTSSFNGSIPDHCPAHDDGDVVHLPHESDCTLFYKCVEGDKIIQQCPPGLHFNPDLQVCDLPEHAKCTSKPGYEVNENQDLSETRQSINLASKRVLTSSFNGSIPDHCPAHDDGDVVHLPHESDCTLFYKCVEGDKIIQQCPPGLHFNAVLQVCDLPEHAKCTSKPGNKGDENQELPEDNGTSSGAPQSSTGVPTSSTPGSIPDHCPSDDTGRVVHLPHETNCSLFYKCHEGKKVVVSCPQGLHFNKIAEVCDYPELAKCTSKPGDKGDENQELPEHNGTSTGAPQSSTRVPTSSTPGSIPDHCPSDDTGRVVHLPHETNCSLFYKCHEGKKVVVSCPQGLHFNKIAEVCDYPELAKCTSKPGDKGDENQELPEHNGTSSGAPQSSTGVPTSSTPGSIPDHCPSDDTGRVVHLPHETNCSLFYKCHEGKKVVVSCPQGLHFNKIAEVCDYPELAKCTSKPGDKGDENQELPEHNGTSTGAPQSSTRVPTSSTPGSIPDHCPSDDTGRVVHLPHETNCSLFYKCHEGKKVVVSCPQGLHFNKIAEVCDYPELAKCTSKPGDKGDENQELPEHNGTSTGAPQSSTGVPSSSTPGSTPDHCPAHDDGDVVHLPHESICTRFYKCVEGEKVVQQCPPGLHFNGILKVCDYPENAKCTNEKGGVKDKN